MPRFAEIRIDGWSAGLRDGGGICYQVQTPTGVLYEIYIDTADDVVFRKSTNGGITWGNSTAVFAGTATQLAVWYDKWSGLAGGLIHLAYSESATDDTLYRTIDTASADALSTQTVVFAGISTANGSHLSITRARGGNVYCKAVIDAGAEGGFFRLPNANVPNGAWDAARTVDEAIATLDQMVLVPGFAADNQDILAIFYDNSATELSRKIYDDSANSWAETSIDNDCTFPAATASFPHFAVAVDLTNSRLVVIMWNAIDTANADLRCWTVTESAITAKTDVVANGTDDQGLCAIGIDTSTGYWYAFYAGKSDGSETWLTSLNIYYKASTDAGTTWSPETLLTVGLNNISTLHCTPNFLNGFGFGLGIGGSNGLGGCLFAIARITQSRMEQLAYG